MNVAEAVPAIGLAQTFDEDELVEMIQTAHAESAMFAGFNKSKVRGELHDTLVNRGGVIGAIRKSNAIRGFAWLTFSQEWYTDDTILVERLVYCRPEYRSAEYARELLMWARMTSEQLGPMLIGVVANNKTSVKARLYRRYFGEPIGFLFKSGATIPTWST